jgi:branched-chain amino acid transport system ATP-binding protein
MTGPLFQARDVVAGYRPDLPIIHGLTMHVDKAEMVTIIGPNGAGKSTMIKAIAGILPISSGSVTLAGKDITRLPTHAMAASSIAYVPQTENVFTTLTINENLLLGASSMPKSKALEQVAKAYENFPALKQYRDKKAKVLSGGQRQMLAVARALLTDPHLIMLDEPSAGLSPLMVSEVFERLRELVHGGVSVLMVEQNAKAAMAVSHRTYVLAEGRNRVDGLSSALAVDPEVKAIYLGAGGRKR